MDPLESQHYIDSFINHEKSLHHIKPGSFKLERVQRLLKDLGNPQNNLKIIHVAGSKGKGSICALTASLLQSSGYKVGLYTSPHINDYRERIRVLNKLPLNMNSDDIFPDMISEEELGLLLDKVKPTIDKAILEEAFGYLSFFELFTILALYYFHKQNVDFAVLETGLGGRLDATNVVDSLIAVLAPISLEHTHLLGKTIRSIAQEKAAIIKSSKQKVVIAPQTVEARKVFQDRCDLFDTDPLWVGDNTHYRMRSQSIEGQTFDLMTSKMQYWGCTLPLLGKHQSSNATVAVSVVECLQDLGFIISTEAIHEGLKNIFWPGRFEIINEERLVVLDGAHNATSMKALVDLMKELFKDKHIILVLGVSQDKDKERIYIELENMTKDIIFTKADHPRAYDFPGALSVSNALDVAFQKSTHQDVILVTGSIFAVSEARRLLKGAQHVPA